MTTAPTRVGIVGYGRMGERHAAAARLLGHEVVGVADPDPAARARADAPTFGDLAHLLGAVELDCLVVAGLADSHAEHVLAAAAAGVPRVLCEKPMSTSLATCDEMLRVCEAAGTRLAVNHQMRYMPHYVALRRAIDDPAFGGWSSITVVTGNIGLAMNGVHYFELFRWLADEPLAEVVAWFSPEVVPNPRGARFEDRAGSLRAVDEAGRRLHLEASADQGHGLVVVVAGGTGILVLDELAGELAVTTRIADHRADPTTRYAAPAHRSVIEVAPTEVVRPTADLLADLLSGGPHPTGADGRAALAALVAAHASAIAGHPIRVADAPLDLVLPIA